MHIIFSAILSEAGYSDEHFLVIFLYLFNIRFSNASTNKCILNKYNPSTKDCSTRSLRIEEFAINENYLNKKTFL